MHFALRFLAASAAAASFSAQAIVVLGTTAGGPTWTRPAAGNPPVGLSGVGVGVNYSITPLFVGTSGSYAFLSSATAPVNWDNFSFLHQTSFNAASPLTNVLVGNDDNTTIGQSGFTRILTAGSQYFFITTGFQPGDAGAWSLDITGPGSISIGVIPEPGTYALMGLGAAAVLLATLRRAPAEG